MRLEIENIGRVEKADIAIQGITVVAGENGTGKSTVSKSLYSILEMSDNMIYKAQAQQKRSLRNAIVNWKRKNAPITGDSTQSFLKKVQEIYAAADGIQEHFQREMTDYIVKRTPTKLLSPQFKEKALPQLFEECSEIAERSLDYYVLYASQMVLDDVFQGQANCLKNSQEGRISRINEDTNIGIKVLGQKIADVNMKIDNDTVRPVYITTPDLMDSVETYSKLYSAERSGTISYINLQLTRLLMERQDNKSLVAEEYHKIEEQRQLLQGLLQEVLEGEFYLQDNRIAYHDRWCDENIELSNIASGMKIFLILQSLVTNGVFLEDTCLIIDEPETNLHPEWQLKLAHLLVLLNKEIGIQIYLNSHSPYFVRAVEYYSDQYQILEQCNFYVMKKDIETGMCRSECVSERLGVIYDKMAEPFNRIM